MRLKGFRLKSAGIGTKLSLLVAVLLCLGFGGLSLILAHDASQQLETEVGRSLTRQQDQVADMISLFDQTLQSESTQFLHLFMAGPGLESIFTVDSELPTEVAGHDTPTLLSGGLILNGDYTLPDKFTGDTGAPVTMFARDGDDFVRVSTSLKKADGTRAVGTKLDHGGRSYAQLMADKPYTGIATLFGTNYITRYEPLHNFGGDVVGASFIGIPITKQLALLKHKVAQMTQGASGYTMLVDASPKNAGQVLAGGPHAGQSLMDIKNAQGDAAFAPIFAKASGRMDYTLASDGRQRITYYQAYPEWNWVIASTVFKDEVNAGIIAMRNRAIIAALILALIFSLMLYFLQRRMISKPLQTMVGMARKLAGGDLSQRVQTRRKDEIGQLTEAMNGIGGGLTDIVGNVRRSTQHVSRTAAEIAQGSEELSARSDQAASNLQETSASIEEITATVQNTSDAADQASKLVGRTSELASEGNSAIQQAQHSMRDINDSSARIGEIITMIDSIAFQTNILALNASVEAARAGEHGRGFAVVAQEVRTLASRSADAAQEIRTLADASIGHARAGDAQVESAAKQMAEILGSVERVNDVIAEISSGAREQSAGIGQINTAVVGLDAMTQQNASMVTQSTKAAADMREQAQTLAELMASFKLDEQDEDQETQTAASPAVTSSPQPARQPAPARPMPEPTPALATADAGDWSTF